jgi:hypothetical protein
MSTNPNDTAGALRFAEAVFPVIPLRCESMRKGQNGKNYPHWVLAVPAGTPGSVDPTQLRAWFISSEDREIAIALPKRLGKLYVYKPDELKEVENCYFPLPHTFTFKASDPRRFDGVAYLFRSPGEDYQVASGADWSWS